MDAASRWPWISHGTEADATLAPMGIAWIAGALAIVVGAMVLLGWTFDVALLKSVLPNAVAMKANTALCFMLIGSAMLASAIRPGQSAPGGSGPPLGAARLLSSLTALIGLLTLAEYAFNWNPGIDQWLFVEPAGAVATSHLGRMAPETALCFVLLAAGLVLNGQVRQKAWITLTSVCAGLLVSSLSLAALLTYLMTMIGEFGWFGLTMMAIHTAGLFALLGLGVIAGAWQRGRDHWSLGARTTLGLGLGMLLLVVIGLNTSRFQVWMKDSSQQIAAGEKIVADIEGLVADIIHTQTSTRGYVITGDERMLRSFLTYRDASLAELDRLRRDASRSTGSSNHHDFAPLAAAATTQLQWHGQVIAARQAGMGDVQRNAMVRHGEDLMDKLRRTAEQSKAEHSARIEQLKREADQVLGTSYLLISGGTLASLAIFATVIFGLNFTMTERLRAERGVRRISEELRRFNETLEARIRERTLQLEAANASLNASTEELARSNLELEQFAYVASHDLQEPLRMVVGFVQLLERRLGPGLDAESREFMDFAVDGALRMQKLIQDILAYSRISSRGQPPQRVDSGAALREALALLEQKLADTGAELNVLPLPTVTADHTQLVQLFQNLIGNAIKFCKDGKPRVTVATGPDPAGWRFTISDNGIGIAPEYRERIFGVFQRLHTRGEYEGTGIGLAICKRIVERHGGTIGVDTAPGGGAAFWFTLPQENGS